MRLRRLSIAGLVALACVTLGFFLGNQRADTLEGFLDQVVLEQDALRAVLAEQTYRLDRVTDLREAAADTAEAARLHLKLEQVTQALAEARGDVDARDATLSLKEGALRSCHGVQSKLERQLEACVFEKASLDKRAGAPSNADDSRPLSGVSPFSESVSYPVTRP